jgi:predicted ArsR family transcriptional regulator
VQAIRSRILETLKQVGQASAGTLADHLDVPPVTVRYHLDILLGDNLIAVSKAKPRGAVGRPQQLYSLTPEADAHFPDNFVLLTAGVVRQMKQLLPEDKVEGCFRALAEEMAQPLAIDSPPDERLDGRMERVVSFLNERGYMAQWEPDSGLLHTHNCPYSGVASEHRELCCMDLALIESLSGQSCERVQAIAEGGRCCSYQFCPPSASEKGMVAIDLADELSV